MQGKQGDFTRRKRELQDLHKAEKKRMLLYWCWPVEPLVMTVLPIIAAIKPTSCCVFIDSAVLIWSRCQVLCWNLMSQPLVKELLLPAQFSVLVGMKMESLMAGDFMQFHTIYTHWFLFPWTILENSWCSAHYPSTYDRVFPKNEDTPVEPQHNNHSPETNIESHSPSPPVLRLY